MSAKDWIRYADLFDDDLNDVAVRLDQAIAMSLFNWCQNDVTLSLGHRLAPHARNGGPQMFKLVTTTIIIAAALTLTGCTSTPTSTACDDMGPVLEDFGYAVGIAADTEDKTAGGQMLRERIISATDKLDAIVVQEGDTEIGKALQALSDSIGMLGTNFSDATKIDFNMASRDMDNACGL
ncbi:hypothetical protein E3T43_07060 [Cryobacterium sp. Hh7]|uniref:hypothetical protein n=1 Tax=Cryobacterium sp. Hh7 TaxID=1259159 RepID=UPI00106B561D|nr:hypothetical protein [Cryobacterium sp. Hh7]TFD58001.1 hypothetical protein E3T43_07060 [Cryobacterium sp. Hh7]